MYITGAHSSNLRPSPLAPCTWALATCKASALWIACRCPYYRNALDSVYPTLNVTDAYSTQYWDALPTTTLNASACGVNTAAYPAKFQQAFFGSNSSPACGQWLQFTSLYPGKGPCYPVLVKTVEYFNRYACPPLHYSHIL